MSCLDQPAGAHPNARRVRGVALRLFAACWLVYTLHFATNTVREIYPALTLGDRLSLDVSEYLGMHSDIFEVPGRGAFINNNPGASILGAIPYVLARPIIDRITELVRERRAAAPEPPPEYETAYPMAREFVREARARGLDVRLGLGAAVMQAGLMAPLSALSAVVMFSILARLTPSPGAAVLLAALYAFATPVLLRTGQLNHNVLVGHFALFAFALLWRPWDDPAHPRRPLYLLAGLLAGWAVVLDYSGLIVPLVLVPYALVRRAGLPAVARSRRDLPELAVGVIASLAVLLVCQWLAFGNPFYPAQTYMPAATYTHLGYRGMSLPQLDLLLETAFGMRYGLFTSAPLLLLALYVPAWRQGGGRIVGRREFWCIVAFCALFFLFTAANQYGRMQFYMGVRHVVPVTPFLFLLAAGVLLRMPRLPAVLVGIIATYWSWCLAMYRDVEQGLGVFESLIHITLEGVRLPWLTTVEAMGYLPKGIFATPLLLLLGLIVWALWRVDPPPFGRVAPQPYGSVPTTGLTQHPLPVDDPAAVDGRAWTAAPGPRS
jgi:hypothetical protein